MRVAGIPLGVLKNPRFKGTVLELNAASGFTDITGRHTFTKNYANNGFYLLRDNNGKIYKTKLSTTFSNFLLNGKLSKLTVKLGANVI